MFFGGSSIEGRGRKEDSESATNFRLSVWMGK